MESFGTPKHILEQAEKDAALVPILDQENADIDVVIKGFKASGNEDEDERSLYQKLGLFQKRHLGTLTTDQTLRFFKNAIRLHAEKFDKESPKYIAMNTLADHLAMRIQHPEIEQAEAA